MNLFIRADAGTAIGTGHVMRSIALAQACKKARGNVNFVCHCESKAMQKLILDEGFELAEIEKTHPDPDDLEKTLGFLRRGVTGDESGTPWLVLDGYHFDPAYQKASRDAGFRVLVIDDYNHQPHYHADILLNQNFKAESLKYICDQDTMLLMGTKYALIRSEFLKKGKKMRNVPVIAQKVLVTLGGADPDNVVLRVVQALKLLDIKGLEAKIVVGPANPHIKKLEKEILRSGDLPRDFQIVQNGNMPDLMAWADIAVSAGGTTCWELAFMGVPFLVLVLAENQRDIAQRLEDAGAALNLGWANQRNTKQISEALENLICNQDKRREMSYRADKLVDGQGASRVSSLMDWLSADKGFREIQMREALFEDCRQIWFLSNDRKVRENSFNTEPIAFEDHVLWYKEKLASSDTAFYVLDICGVIGGQVRYERKGSVTEISYSLDPAFRGIGLGETLIESTIYKACKKLKVDRVHAVVKNFNKASIKTFLNIGFRKVHDEKIKGLDSSVFERGISQQERRFL